MVRSHYVTGTAFERQVIDDLSGRGYITVRAAGSKGSAKVDVIAVRGDGSHLWIQCKSGAGAAAGEPLWKLAPGEWNALWAAVSPLAGVVALVAAPEPLGPRGGLQPAYRRITGPREPGSRTWPVEPFDVEKGASVSGWGGVWNADDMQHWPRIA